MSSPTNPFLSPDDDALTEESGIASTPQQFPVVLTPPARAQLRGHDAFSDLEDWPLPSPAHTADVEIGSPFALAPSSVYADRTQNISNPTLLRPLHPERTFSMTNNGWNEKSWAVYDEAPRCASRSRLVVCFQATKRAILNHVDPESILEMVDVREFFWPFSLLQYTALLFVAMAVAGIVVSNFYTHWIEKSMAITRQYMLPVLIIVIGLEPLMITFILLVARISDLSSEDAAPSNDAACADSEARMSAAEKVADHRTALVIPCHNSDEEAMKRVLESAYPHFRPKDIFVVDNGRSKYPKNDDFRQFIRRQHPDIVYIWSPIGSKNAAQLVGALAAKDYEFIMTVDDDVSIPANFRPPIDKVDHLTKGVAFPLKAIDATGKTPLFMVAWQDCEYRMAGLSKLAESAVCGVLYPHGAGWFCERETLIDLISNYHSIDFIAEDVNTGLSMQKMKKRIAFDARMILETEVPTTILGPGLNWWKQRKNSWEMGRHGRLLAFVGRLFLSLNGQNTIQGVLEQKFIHLYAIASIVVDWVRVPVLVTMGGNLHYWRQALLLTLVSILPLLAYKYISCRRRPDLQPGFWASMTYPLYKQLYSLVSVFGAIRSVMYYIGGHKRPKTIRQMTKENDERILWLDPRFETNPGYLADEGEALRASAIASYPAVNEVGPSTIDCCEGSVPVEPRTMVSP